MKNLSKPLHVGYDLDHLLDVCNKDPISRYTFEKLKCSIIESGHPTASTTGWYWYTLHDLDKDFIDETLSTIDTKG